MNGKTVAGLALILGAVMFLLGGDLGGFIVFLLSVGLLYYGWRKWQQSVSTGGKALGIGAVIFGALLLFRWIPFLVGLLMAAVCIYFGWRLIRQDREPSGVVPESGAEANPVDRPRWEDDFESEWKRFLERHGDKK